MNSLPRALVKYHLACHRPAMRILGVDAPQGYALLDVPVIGQPRVLVIGCLDGADRADELVDVVRRLRPERVAIERPIKAYVGGRGDGEGDAAGARRATVESLIAVAHEAGAMWQACRALGVRVVECDAATSRRATGAGRDDAAVRSWVTRIVAGWPERSNAHERDAAVAAIWGARQ